MSEMSEKEEEVDSDQLKCECGHEFSKNANAGARLNHRNGTAHAEAMKKIKMKQSGGIRAFFKPKDQSSNDNARNNDNQSGFS